MSKTFTVDQLVNMFIGHIDSIGETNYDKKSLENLETAEGIIDKLLHKLIDNSEYTGFEHSAFVIKTKSKSLLQAYRNMIDETLSECQ